MHKYKHAKVLAKMSGLSQSTMSRILSRKAYLDQPAARKLAQALEADNPGAGVTFFISYLDAQIPKWLRPKLSVSYAQNGQLREGSLEITKLCQIFSMLSPEAKAYILHSAEFQLQHLNDERAKALIPMLENIMKHCLNEAQDQKNPPS
jgi:transcriptional regulator with XRE-family HTH domain